MKAFNTNYHKDYYKNWVYLGTISGQDYYFQGLPTIVNPFPSYSIVYGIEDHEYISTTIPVKRILDDSECSRALSFYVDTHNLNYMIHMIAFIRTYANERGAL